MRAVVLSKYGAPEVLKVTRVGIPQAPQAAWPGPSSGGGNFGEPHRPQVTVGRGAEAAVLVAEGVHDSLACPGEGGSHLKFRVAGLSQAH